MEQSLNEFSKAREEFLKRQPQPNKDILKLVAQTIGELMHGPEKTSEGQSGFLAWDAKSLIEKEAMLSGSIRRLLHLKAEYEAKADWLKTDLNSKEQDIYQNVIKDNKKVTVDSFKRQLAQMQKEGIQQIILLKNEAKNVDAFAQCVDKLSLVISHRLKEIRG